MIESRFHVKAYPVFTSRPEFGFDIDKEEHYLKTLELIEKEAIKWQKKSAPHF